MIALLATFWVLVLALRVRQGRVRPFAWRRPWDWGIDLLGLGIQGWGVPLLQSVLVFGLLHRMEPGLRGALDIPPWASFALGFVAVDYLYYWNHRWLHTRRAFWVHAVHHTLPALDVFGTSRNTVWATLFLCYWWAGGLFLYLLHDPAPYAAAATLTAGLDLWRHSDLGPRPGSRLHRSLSRVLITPVEHGWHHTRGAPAADFGANLSVWDRLHGTFHRPEQPLPPLGIPLEMGPWRRLAWPRPVRGEGRVDAVGPGYGGGP